MSDLLEILGISEEDINESKSNKKQKKPEEKKDGKKPSKKSSGNKFQLPVKFCGGHLQHIFGTNEDGEWSEDELKKKIRDEFRELAGIYFKLKSIELEEKEEGVATYVKPEIVYKEITDEEKLEFPLEVVAGKATLWQDTKISIEEIRGLWVKEHPEYQGCKFMYDEKQKILVPYMEATAAIGKTYNLPITVGYLDIKETYTEDDLEDEELTEDVFRQLYSKNHPEFVGCSFAYVESENLLFPIVKEEKENDNKNISLPVEVRAGGFRIIVSPEDVNGKGEASLEEIRKVLEGEYPEYSKERTEMTYDKRHFVVPILKSSRKGMQIISERKDYKHDIVTDENKCQWRVESRPFGVFKRNLTDEGSVEFELTAPKIPWAIVEKSIELFRKNPTYEFAVQIFYDVEEKTYSIYVPEQECGRAQVVFHRNFEMEEKKVLVMDIHSHASFHAFFSSTDNEDEKGIRLYMVIGNLDQPKCSFKIRAGMAGTFGDMALADVFSMQEVQTNACEI